MKTVIKFVKSITSLLILNIIFFYIKFIKNKKVIFFYHAENKTTDISINYINYFFYKKKNVFETIFGYNGKEVNLKKYFFINERFLFLLFGVDYLVTNYLLSTAPLFCKKIYIHHDIYDTPLVGRDMEKTTYLELSKQDKDDAIRFLDKIT